VGFLNKCILLGNLTRDPEVSYIPDKNLYIAKFGLAVSRYRKSTGQKEDVCFIDIVTFGRTAEFCGEYVSKGMSVLIEGRLNYKQWEQEGTKKSKHEIVAENVQLVSKPKAVESDTSFPPEDTDNTNDEDLPF